MSFWTEKGMCKDWNTPNDFLPLQNSSENYAGSRRYECGDKIKDKIQMKIMQVHVDINVEILDILSVNDKEFSITMSM